MNKRQKAFIQAAASRYLMPGEEIEIVAFAGRGNAQVKQNTARFGLAIVLTAIVAALGGAMFAFVKPAQRPSYIVLTDRKIIMFAANQRTGGAPGYLGSVPRADATASIIKAKIKLTVQLDVVAPTKQSVGTTRLPSMRLSFPPVPPSARQTGRQFVAALQVSTAPEATPAKV